MPGEHSLNDLICVLIMDCLSQFDLEQHLGLFIRDEVVLWHLYNNKPIGNDITLKQIVNQIVESISKKAEILSCRMERETAVSFADIYHELLGTDCPFHLRRRWPLLLTKASVPTPYITFRSCFNKLSILSTSHEWRSSGSLGCNLLLLM